MFFWFTYGPLSVKDKVHLGMSFEILSLFVFSGCDTGTAPMTVFCESHKYMTSHLINNVIL